jgi:gamma-glutamyl-gamma-aminobutyrate hydrolase PuuD
MIIVIPAGPEKTTYQINKAYIDYIADSGYTPWLVTPHIDLEVLTRGHVGLLLPGGKDIDPIFYGDSNWGSHASDPDKDKFERSLFWAFMKKGRPIFGICRGFQLIIREYMRKNPGSKENMIYQQHISSHSATTDFGLIRTIPSHYVTARIDLLYGKTKTKNGKTKTKIDYMPVNSMHHQYLHVYKEEKELAKNPKIASEVRLTAWTKRGLDVDEAGVVGEGITIEGWGKSKIAAVQWHPEELKDCDLLKYHFGEK